MTIPTVAMGLLPTFIVIGGLAPLLVTLLRLLQGLAVGGEFTGTMAFLVETAPDNRRGFMGSFALVGVLCGILLGVANVAIMTRSISHASLISWGWRIPFLFGGILGLIVWLLRKNISETPIY